MRHPGPLLTDYVDDSLAPDARAEVQAHLTGCASCREEVRLAVAGKQAVDALPEPRVPAGLAGGAIAEASRIAAERSPEVTRISSAARRRPNAPRWPAFAAAAAVVALVALVGPRLGQAPRTAAEPAAAPGGDPYPTATAVEIQRANYTFEELPEATSQFRSAYLSTTAGQFAAQDGAAEGFEGGPSVVTITPPMNATADRSVKLLGDATACLDRAFDQPPGSLTRVIRADYEGELAYFGVYLVGPGEGLPPQVLHLDVASVRGCRLLGQSTARL